MPAGDGMALDEAVSDCKKGDAEGDDAENGKQVDKGAEKGLEWRGKTTVE